MKVLFKISGSIAAYKACGVISSLKKAGHEIKVVVTKDALNFIGLSSLEGLSSEKVHSDIHESGNMMEHIHLNTWADLVVLCPASANTLAKISHGQADNLLTTLFLSRNLQKPYLIFPAMNPKMWLNPMTQKNVQLLKESGCAFHLGKEGSLACGDYGPGRLMEPEEIFNEINKAWLQYSNTKIFVDPNLEKNSQKKILITAGGTQESIDAIRVLSNLSTGRTGAALAHALSSKYQVTFLGSDAAIQELSFLQGAHIKHKGYDGKNPEDQNIQVHEFTSFKDLEKNLKALMQENDFDSVIHLAAVSDFSPLFIQQGDQKYPLPLDQKLSSSESISIEFKRNPKLIEGLRAHLKKTNAKIIGFKLLQERSKKVVDQQIHKVLQSSDYVVLNFLDEITDKSHKFKVYSHKGLFCEGYNKKDLVLAIDKILMEVSKTKADQISNRSL